MSQDMAFWNTIHGFLQRFLHTDELQLKSAQSESKGDSSMAAALCLGCGNRINLGARPLEGQQLICTKCGARLEVISLRPLELDWAYDEPYHDLEEYWQIKHDLFIRVT
jgi:lysine biosynthesis protein LysW